MRGVLEILQYPDRRLTTPSRLVRFDELREVNELAMHMRAAMKANGGIGIAASQVGSPLRVCIVRGLTMINPELTYESEARQSALEGCLSVYKSAKRYQRLASVRVTVTFLDVKGKSHVKSMYGIDARCVQHELRHLSGLLINEGHE